MPPGSENTLFLHMRSFTIQATECSAIPEDMDITPSLVNYACNSTDTVPVEISNITTRTLAVNPRSLLCEMQPIRIESMSNASIKTQGEIEPFLESLNMDREALRSDEFRRGIELKIHMLMHLQRVS